MKVEHAAALRKPFPSEAVGKLPKPLYRDSTKGNCPECHGYHGMPAVHLDYVGHAAVTDRLLSVDPGWSWEPLALDDAGLPALDRKGNLWIRLTICGVTRIGVGDGGSAKECIGDAIRNAAMRFGVALDLWSKEELEQAHAPASAAPFSEHGTNVPPQTSGAEVATDTSPSVARTAPSAPESPLLNTSSKLAKAMYAAIREHAITKEETPGLYQQVTGRVVESSKELTDEEARAVLAYLDRLKAAMENPFPTEPEETP